MALHLADKWLWDFWFAQDGADFHIFYLQADRALQDEGQRHWHVSIGHAVSRDLRTWTRLPDALRPSDDDRAWDNYTTWTGSIIHHDGLWYMLYTGTTRAEDGLVQRIGLATSRDLVVWHKHPTNPVLSADPTWYELLDRTLWHDQAWRDPYVVQDADTGVFHAFITARHNAGPADSRGAVGHATSTDLMTWQVQPPLAVPRDFGHLEVPQILQIQGRWYLLFSSPYETQAKAFQARAGRRQSGTHYMVADAMLGPYRSLTDDYLVGDEVGALYSGKLIQDQSGAWQFVAFENRTAWGEFAGNITDPYPVEILADGRLRVQFPGR